MADNRTGNPQDEAAALEREVRRTQDEMGRTVDKLEEKMNPRDMARDALGDDGADVAKEALEVTRQNPIPVAMIAVGLIWLLATSRSPAITRLTQRMTGKKRGSRSEFADLRPRSAEPAPIGPPPVTGDAFDRRMSESSSF